jgi:hypothetical protein
MTTIEFATYSKFHDAEGSSFLVALLNTHQVPYKTVQEQNQLDHVYIGETLDPMFAVQIPRDKFALVNNLLADKATEDFSNPSFTHYLNEFNIDELKSVVYESDSWNAYDVQIAKLLLKKRSGVVTANIDKLKEEELLGEKIETQNLVLGYSLVFLGLLTTASSSLVSLFTLAGVLIGASIVYSKKTSSSGQSVFIYEPKSRKRGMEMLVIGIIVLAIVLYIIVIPQNL